MPQGPFNISVEKIDR